MHPQYIDMIVMATVCLHNLIKSEENLVKAKDRIYCPPHSVDSEDSEGNIIPGEWRQYTENALRDIPPTSKHHATTIAYKQRDKVADYFLTPPGEVPWQYDYVRRGQHRDDP
ncbi:nuclease harbi1-like protein [Lasius niger]|uniref:Nuclease harbi1-like protein n=1 Tax=Lasius niger TaxID=67767 RepID=A0A0J7KBU5_LASNI|nr:nuclease harbi1-like protein [Lasius niger]